eukprot:TRINITY_DN80024_c0_g1_i1.p1 TRINITY_DN80024_c0_g1~~TRINITY_DN80024_c0_g1_i1.p1  ORF type:complete len:669 (-),score=91.91 TRINITY_DN80024_c0_g1_i1:17-2023(-)
MPLTPYDYDRHTLETSPLTNLFPVLWRRKNQWWLYEDGQKDSADGLRLRIPDTVVWENNIPKAWYHFDAKEGILRRKVESTLIFQAFTKEVADQSTEVVATVLTHVGGASLGEKPQTSAEFLNYHDLNEFLFAKKRGKGCCILQQFIPPQNESKNDTLQAIWSPKVMMLNRRQNIHNLNDPKLPLYSKAVTLEGPSHFSHIVHCTPRLKADVKTLCEEVVNHFHDTDTKHTISRIVLHFKVDVKRRLWLLYCTSVRILPTGRAATRVPYIALDLSPECDAQDDEQSGPTRPQTATVGFRVVSVVHDDEDKESNDKLDALLTDARHIMSASRAEFSRSDSHMSALSPAVLYGPREAGGGATLVGCHFPVASPTRVSEDTFSSFRSTRPADGSVRSLLRRRRSRATLEDSAFVRLQRAAVSPQVSDSEKLELLFQAFREREAERSKEHIEQLISRAAREAALRERASWDKLTENVQSHFQQFRLANTLLIEFVDDLLYRAYSHFLLFDGAPGAGLPPKRKPDPPDLRKEIFSKLSQTSQDWFLNSEDEDSATGPEITPFQFHIPSKLQVHSGSLLEEVLASLGAVFNEHEDVYEITHYVPIRSLCIRFEKIKAEVREKIREREERLQQQLKDNLETPLPEFERRLQRSQMIDVLRLLRGQEPLPVLTDVA